MWCWCVSGLECEIDIQKTVEEARAGRSGMVQTEEQYRFIYDVIKHYIDTQKPRIVAQVCESQLCNVAFMLWLTVCRAVFDGGSGGLTPARGSWPPESSAEPLGVSTLTP